MTTESKPVIHGTYYGEVSPDGKWKWEGTGKPDDDWSPILTTLEPEKPTQQVTASQVAYDWIELYLTPVTGP
jgi:hypothetical protein